MRKGSLGNLDPKTEEIKWYPLAPEYNDYRVQLNFVGLRHDIDGKVWTKSVGTQDIYRLDLATNKWERFQPLTDRAVRLDPATGKSVEYQLPHETNMRTVFVDNSTTPVTFWTGSNHGAALVKLEPLD